MLVLLPPSQGKTEPESGDPVDLAALAFPELTEAREALIDALDPSLARAPAAPAHEVYSGVLFERLRLGELPAEARERVLIQSALWGMLRPDDRIPAYRLDMGAKLEGIGNLTAHWREPLARALPDEGLILDMRSGAYAKAWRPADATSLTVRGFSEDEDGSRKPVTHMVKRIRGDVARIVLESAPEPPTPAEVLELVEAGGHTAELDESQGTLDVIERKGS